MKPSYLFSKRPSPKIGLSSTHFNLASSIAFALAACGSNKNKIGDTEVSLKGFPLSYKPPEANYDMPGFIDPYAYTLNVPYTEPYWVQALEMDQPETNIVPILLDHDRVIGFAFPELQPGYYHFGVTGWQPATDKMKVATREILSKLEAVLDISFAEVNDPNAKNVIAIGQSLQVTSSGLSYYPNSYYEIGMDVFISTKSANPRFTFNGRTNYDYEVLLHEVGHALGLKHPFEASGTNNMTLSTYEDNTYNTAMSYTYDPVTFNGDLRSLDWMTLAKFYGVNLSYNAADDTYNFSNLGGTFILDGAGLDTINADATSEDVTIDLRPGSHSHLGLKATYITAPNQLAISHGSDIENAVTGSGDDIVIGTNLDNVISTGNGSDTIFAGGGADIIKSGLGADQIDLSEDVQSRDTVSLDVPSADLGIDKIYGFVQGALGDIFDISAILGHSFELFPLVASGSAPTANFDGGILRLIGSDVSTANDLLGSFKLGGDFETLSMSKGSSALIISAVSQSTGENQHIFSAEKNSDEGISIIELAVLQGNALDIDQWHTDNFSIFA